MGYSDNGMMKILTRILATTLLQICEWLDHPSRHCCQRVSGGDKTLSLGKETSAAACDYLSINHA